MTGPARAVVLGAGGQVGEGVVGHLLDAGWHVTALGRSRDGSAALVERLGDPPLLEAVVAQPDAWAQVAAGLPVPELVVASLGGWSSGPVLTVLPLAEARRAVQDGLLSHLEAAQAFLPVLETAGGGTYVMLNGGGALEPVPGSGIVCTVAAAQLMLARALAAEAVSATVRSLVISTPVLSASRPRGPAGWVTARDVGAAVLALHDDPGADVVVHTGPAPRA